MGPVHPGAAAVAARTVEAGCPPLVDLTKPDALMSGAPARPGCTIAVRSPEPDVAPNTPGSLLGFRTARKRSSRNASRYDEGGSMSALPPAGACLPTPVYGVVILVLVLVCLVLLAYRGLDVMIATNALVTVTLASAELTGRLLRHRHRVRSHRQILRPS